jgi:MSHA pilin protein MshC
VDKIKSKRSSLLAATQGFTLIELIIVIIILSILSVTVAPKFFTSAGFSEFTYRSDVIAKLRLIQTRAMQQTNESCHRVKITTKEMGRVDCDIAATFVNQSLQRATVVSVDSSDNVSFSPEGVIFNFNHLGQPFINDINTKIEITITGEQSLIIVVESEGYIHAL